MNHLPASELDADLSIRNFRQSDIRISSAILIDGLALANVYNQSFKANFHTLNLGKGICLRGRTQPCRP